MLELLEYVDLPKGKTVTVTINLPEEPRKAGSPAKVDEDLVIPVRNLGAKFPLTREDYY